MNIYVDTEDKVNNRLDIIISESSSYSRTYVTKLIENGLVKVNGKVIDKASYKTKLNDVIEYEVMPEKVLEVSEENIPLNILYEDNDILIIDKERGMVVHPSNGHESGTLVNAIMYHCKDSLSTINGVVRPGIVHRIDKDTSGILCICKNDISHQNISTQFANHTNIRKYKAIVKGNLKNDSGTLDYPIGRDKNNRLKMSVVSNGKNAVTKYKVLKHYNNYTYIECELLTGRTHQIRVHMSHIGHPLLGDKVYGRSDKLFPKLDGQILHAYYLKFMHPTKNVEMEFESDLPQYFVDVLNKLDG